MRPALCAWLAGCGAPISNQFFLDEGAFLGALPSERRLEAPASVLFAPNGDANPLAVAKREAERWETFWAVAAATGDELRAFPAHERTEVARRWRGVNVSVLMIDDALGLDGQIVDWWVEADVVLADDAAPQWTVSLAATEDGPYVEVGGGETAGAAGTLWWDVAMTAEILGGAPPTAVGSFEASFEDFDPAYSGIRTVTATHDVGGTLVPYGLIGDELFAFTAPLEITLDNVAWPAFATVAHTVYGGRAEGTVLEGGTERAFTSCWDANGMLLWQAGDGEVFPAGSTESACPVGPF